jgi:uncharacterized membrane protein YgcG
MKIFMLLWMLLWAGMSYAEGAKSPDIQTQDEQAEASQNAAVEAEEAQPGKKPFPIPDGYNLVNDYHGVLTIAQVNILSEKLTRLEKKNGTQIVLMIVPTVGDMPINEYADKVMEKWDPGNHGEGNGLLYLISADPPAFWFATEGGIAGALPDIKLRHIWQDHMDPHFRRQEWFEGINETVDALIAAASGEDTAAGNSHPQVIFISRDQLIAAALAVIGGLYAAFLLFKKYRSKNQGA